MICQDEEEEEKDNRDDNHDDDDDIHDDDDDPNPNLAPLVYISVVSMRYTGVTGVWRGELAPCSSPAHRPWGPIIPGRAPNHSSLVAVVRTCRADSGRSRHTSYIHIILKTFTTYYILLTITFIIIQHL